jgi:hypothetical protein
MRDTTRPASPKIGGRWARAIGTFQKNARGDRAETRIAAHLRRRAVGLSSPPAPSWRGRSSPPTRKPARKPEDTSSLDGVACHRIEGAGAQLLVSGGIRLASCASLRLGAEFAPAAAPTKQMFVRASSVRACLLQLVGHLPGNAAGGDAGLSPLWCKKRSSRSRSGCERRPSGCWTCRRPLHHVDPLTRP